MTNEKFRIGRKVISCLTKKPPVLSSPYHVIIWQLIKDPDDFSGVDWARETRAAKELYFTYSNLRFWSQMSLGFYLNSLNFFKSTNGVKHLREAIAEFERASKIKFVETKEDEFDDSRKFDKKIDKDSKPLNHKDLFKNGKKTK
jgi:hypothetical protein|tara:strand:+ start:1698 stop:2129 length:432 start_codon:yes stop_codon:yes gene_type:complete